MFAEYDYVLSKERAGQTVDDPTGPGPTSSTFEQLLEAAPDAIVGVDDRGQIVLVNSQTEALFGYPRDDLLGQAVEMLVPERFREVHPGHRSGYFAEPRTRPMGAELELYGRRRDGSEFPAEISLSSIETEGGRLATAAIRDVTVTPRGGEEVRAVPGVRARRDRRDRDRRARSSSSTSRRRRSSATRAKS